MNCLKQGVPFPLPKQISSSINSKKMCKSNEYTCQIAQSSRSAGFEAVGDRDDNQMVK
jgi:hypothetical protein